ncbi:MAG: glycosyltransferase [Ignavibacteriae bacterium]|nr:glycosyltransferase [Ignavibacteria bacterium]MBI3364689.1 glycosyltransferase [Ignavibacteriota bacterium]
MNILYLLTDLPFPPIGGGRSRSFYLLKALASKDEVTVVSFVSPETSLSDIDAVRQYCVKIITVPMNTRHYPLRFLESLLARTPYKVLQYSSEEFAMQVRILLNTGTFDIVLSEHPYLAPYLPDPAKACVIPQNIEMMFSIYKRFALHGNLLMRFYAATQWRKLMRYELTVYRKYGTFIALNQCEFATIKSLVPNIRTCLVPNGVDVEYFSPSQQRSAHVHTNIVFTGVFSYYPNEQAALTFSREILPIIRKRIPQIRFTIVGKDPSKRIRRLVEDPHITVTGFVNDVRPYMEKASVIVVPLRIGGGTRLKILEALAMGKPVISTTIGCEGLNVEHRKNVLIADTAEEFAQAVINVLEDSVLANSLGREGRQLVEREYRWEVIGDRLHEFLKQRASENHPVSLQREVLKRPTV